MTSARQCQNWGWGIGLLSSSPAFASLWNMNTSQPPIDGRSLRVLLVAKREFLGCQGRDRNMGWVSSFLCPWPREPKRTLALLWRPRGGRLEAGRHIWATFVKLSRSQCGRVLRAGGPCLGLMGQILGPGLERWLRRPNG